MKRRILESAFGWLLLMAIISTSAIAANDGSCTGALERSVWIVVLRDGLSSELSKTCLDQISVRVKDANDVNYLNHLQMVIVNAHATEVDQINKLDCVDSVYANIRFSSPDGL